ncbi:MAG: CPBP family intramembrane metalloprotease, partial [Heliobacteriaceae bacterium]|nr:CPBP family intramembrane metalloprotease [Heliobacteriaceae bacterium]
WAGSLVCRLKVASQELGPASRFLMPGVWNLTSLGQGLIVGGQIFLLLTGLGLLAAWLMPAPEHPVQQILRQPGITPGQVGLVVLAVGVIAPLAEEVFFRGFLLPALAIRWGANPANHLSAILFGALHGSFYEFFLLYLAGLLLGRAALVWGNFVPAVIGHAVWNFWGLAVVLSGW